MKFSPANTKLRKLQKKTGRKVYSFDLLSGHSCPGAKSCLAKVVYDWATDSYSLEDGEDQEFRCYSASQENQYPGTYNHRLANWESVDAEKNPNKLSLSLLQALPSDAETVRIHSSGDFFTMKYFQAWISLAKREPDKLFYAYTKFLPAWIKYRKILPDNMVLTASRGGKWDHLIDQHGLREVKVIYDPSEANGLAIDSDDSIAADPLRRNENFALLIHGQGKAGSRQAKVMYARTKAMAK